MDDPPLKLCSNCSQRPATVHFITINCGSKKSESLCPICFDAICNSAGGAIADWVEAWKKATCQYCGGKAAGGGTSPFNGLQQQQEYKFMCQSCSTEFYQAGSGKFDSLSDSMEGMTAEQQTLELQRLIDEMDLHMKQWLGRRLN